MRILFGIKKIEFRLLLALCIAYALAGCCRKDGEYYVDIFATNDLHGKLFDSLYVDNQINRYSLANVSEYMKIAGVRTGGENVLLLDLGDVLQGDNSVYYTNFIDTVRGSGKHLFTRIAEYIGYDALIVGNHDIEAGHPVYDRIKSETDIPYLAANAIDVTTGNSYFEPYTILKKGELKIAVIGMTNPNIKKWLGEELWRGMDFLPIEKLADSLVNRVNKLEKPDITILAIHAGLGDGSADDIENPARYLAAKLKGVDIIFASHDHQTACEKIWNGVDSVLVMEGSNRAKYLANVVAIVQYKDNRLVDKSFNGRLIPMEKIPVDKEYMQNFREDFLKTKHFTNQEIGELDNDIFTADAFFGPSDYIDLIHTVQLKASKADISLAAPLTFNGHIRAGKLRYHDLFTIYPFENQLYVVALTGEQIKKYLEYSYENWISTMSSPADHIMKIGYDEKSGRYFFKNMTFNFDSGAGINYTVDVRKPFGERVSVGSMADGTPFDTGRIYRVALSSYRANGGGDLLTEGAGIELEKLDDIVLEKFDDIRTLVFDYYKNIQNRKAKDPYNSDSSDRGEKVEASWKFIPEKFVSVALERDRKLLFGSAEK